jgi:hypothetical protein
MKRLSYYAISTNAWIFGKDQETNPEEQVRQWCVQELIRAYGFQVTDITFEHSVRVGSKTYRIDILICREDKPWIVVECKRQEHTKHEQGLEQAISYAAAEEIRAEFAIYTNGEAWLVKRRIGSSWVSVLDLPPKAGDGVSDTTFDVHLHRLFDLKAVLRMLDIELQGRHALRFLHALQCLFNGSHGWCHANDGLLLDAADNLLRAMVSSRDIHYALGKLIHATEQVRLFVAGQALECLFPPPAKPASINEEFHWLDCRLYAVMECINDGGSPDTLLIRLIHSLVGYAREIPSRAWRFQYPPIPHSLHSNLRSYLSMVLKLHFALSLPDATDRIRMDDLRKWCDEAWRTFDQD